MVASEIFFTLIILFSAATAVQSIDDCCSSVKEVVARAAGAEAAHDQQMVFSSRTSSNVGGICKLDSTCCSLRAENVLKEDITEFYQSHLDSFLQGTIPGCMNSSLQSDSITFLEGVKSFAMETMRQIWHHYASNFDYAFDGLFNYMENGIATLDLCDLEAQYQSMFFEVYSTSLTTLLKLSGLSTDSLSDPSSRACFYQYFMEAHGAAISNDYHRVEQRYNIFLRYLQALATSDQALKRVLNHVLSPECQDSLLRMTHCAQCAGVSDSSVLPCKNLCQNVQRGCLVDIYELGDVYKKLYVVLKDAQDVMTEYDPFGVMESLAAQVVKMLDDFTQGHKKVADDLSTQCGLSFSPSKRSIPMRLKIRTDSKIIRRETSQPPLDTMADTVSCAKSVYHLLQTLSTKMCMINNSDSDNTHCWNGTHVGSYNSALSGKGRLFQPDNPEIELTRTTGLLYLDAIAQLKNVTKQLEECTYNVEGCSIKFCNRTIPLPSDYDVASEERYAPFSVAVEPPSNCAPTCTPDYCKGKLKAKCTIPSTNTQNISSCFGDCDETVCSACYYSGESLPRPTLDKNCPTFCPVDASGKILRMTCLRKWGRCIRSANVGTYGKPTKEMKRDENYKCWRPSCQGVE